MIIEIITADYITSQSDEGKALINLCNSLKTLVCKPEDWVDLIKSINVREN